METKVLGMNGRSWRDAARIPYSCANITAEANSADRCEAWLPTILKTVSRRLTRKSGRAYT